MNYAYICLSLRIIPISQLSHLMNQLNFNSSFKIIELVDADSTVPLWWELSNLSSWILKKWERKHQLAKLISNAPHGDHKKHRDQLPQKPAFFLDHDGHHRKDTLFWIAFFFANFAPRIDESKSWMGKLQKTDERATPAIHGTHARVHEEVMTWLKSSSSSSSKNLKCTRWISETTTKSTGCLMEGFFFGGAWTVGRPLAAFSALQSHHE